MSSSLRKLHDEVVTEGVVSFISDLQEFFYLLLSCADGTYFCRLWQKYAKARFWSVEEVRSGGKFCAFGTKIFITPAQFTATAHGQLCLKLPYSNESADSVVFIKLRTGLPTRQPFICRAADIRRPLYRQHKLRLSFSLRKSSTLRCASSSPKSLSGF